MTAKNPSKIPFTLVLIAMLSVSVYAASRQSLAQWTGPTIMAAASR